MDWGLDVWGNGVDTLVLNLKINCGHISSERSIVLEPGNIILLGCSISVVMLFIISSLFDVLTPLVIPVVI